MSSRKKLAIATHAFEMVDFDIYYNHMFCAMSWSQMKDYELLYLGKKGLQAADARNRIVQQAIDAGCEYIFFLDADHYITTQTLELLLENRDEAMVSGLICKRGNQYEQVGFVVKPDGYFLNVNLPLDGNLYDVGVCAFGCTLINLAKLQELEKPYFRDTCKLSADGEQLVNVRSDVNLCQAFREKGHKVWIDTRVLIGHRGGNKVIYPQNAEFYRHMKWAEKDAIKLDKEQKGNYFIPEGLGE